MSEVVIDSPISAGGFLVTSGRFLTAGSGVRGPLGSPLSGADRELVEETWAARLSRVRDNLAFFHSLYHRSRDRAMVAAHHFMPAIRDLLWAARTINDFSPAERLELALLAGQVADGFWLFPRRFNHPLLQRVLDIGFGFAGSVSDQFPERAALARAVLHSCRPIEGAAPSHRGVAWSDPHLVIAPAALELTLRKFEEARNEVAAVAGSEGNLFEAIGRPAWYMVAANQLRAAKRRLDQARELLDPKNSLQVQNYMVHEAFLAWRRGDDRRAVELLREREAVLVGLPERAAHLEAGNTFFLRSIDPGEVGLSELIRAAEVAATSPIGHVTGSDLRRDAGSIPLLGATPILRNDERVYTDRVTVAPMFPGDRQSAHHQLESGSVSQAGPSLDDASVPARPRVVASIEELRGRMEQARRRAGLTMAQVGAELEPGPASKQAVEYLLKKAVDPGLFQLAAFAAAVGVPLLDLLNPAVDFSPGTENPRRPEQRVVDSVEELRGRMEQARRRAGLTMAQVGAELEPGPASKQAVEYLLKKAVDPGLFQLAAFAAAVGVPLLDLLNPAVALADSRTSAG